MSNKTRPKVVRGLPGSTFSLLLWILLGFVAGTAKTPGTVEAREGAPRAAIEATVRIEVGGGAEGQGIQGSGVLIGGDVVATAGHMTWGQSRDACYGVTTWNGGVYAAYLLAQGWEGLDIAVLKVRDFKAAAKPVRWGMMPRDGDGLWIVGWPLGEGSLNQGWQGQLDSVSASSEATKNSRLCISAVFPGHSGSGVWDCRGRLVGLLWGCSSICDHHGIYLDTVTCRNFVSMHVKTDFYEFEPPPWWFADAKTCCWTQGTLAQNAWAQNAWAQKTRLQRRQDIMVAPPPGWRWLLRLPRAKKGGE